jgi:hypothetical protein
MSISLNQIASNVTSLCVGANEILFSYRTPVAAYISGTGLVRSKTRYSQTTSKHINSWLKTHWGGAACSEVEQDTIDELLSSE